MTPAYIIFPRQEQPAYWLLDNHPKLVSGSPVFQKGELICILSSNGRCKSYLHLHSTVKIMMFDNVDILSDAIELSPDHPMCRYNCENQESCRYRHFYKRTLKDNNTTASVSYARRLHCGEGSGIPFCTDSSLKQIGNLCLRACNHVGGCRYECNYANSDEMRCNGMPDYLKRTIGVVVAFYVVIITATIEGDYAWKRVRTHKSNL